MQLRIDKAGRIVVPKPIRDRLGLRPDTELIAVEQPGGLLLRRATERPSMIQIDGLWVHQGTPEPAANWDLTLDRVRDERIDSVLNPSPGPYTPA